MNKKESLERRCLASFRRGKMTNKDTEYDHSKLFDKLINVDVP